jgi:hypothetical protein
MIVEHPPTFSAPLSSDQRRCGHELLPSHRPGPSNLPIKPEAKVARRCAKNLISLSISLPARTAAASGEKGEIPSAIRSALMKFLQSVYLGRNVRANVVLPTPFGPAGGVPARPEFDRSCSDAIEHSFRYSWLARDASDRAAKRRPDHFLRTTCPTLVLPRIRNADGQVVSASIAALPGTRRATSPVVS